MIKRYTADSWVLHEEPQQFQFHTAEIDSWNEALEDKSAEEIIDWVLTTFPNQVVFTTSFGIHSAVMTHLLYCARHHPITPSIWIDTGYLPPQTYQYAATLTERFQLNLHTYQSTLSPAHMEARFGKLYELASDDEAHRRYHYLRKVEPMRRALETLNPRVILTGVRADQTHVRSQMNIVNHASSRRRLKVCPLLRWTKSQLEDYLDEHGLPRHPLEARGYVSVGDAHSSRPFNPTLDQDERDTRFHGRAQECGLHLDDDDDVMSHGYPAEWFHPNSTHHPHDHDHDDHEEDSTSIQQQTTHIFTIYSRPSCQRCVQAQELLRSSSSSWDIARGGWIIRERVVGVDIDTLELQQRIGKEVMSVPQIFVNKVYIGGLKQLSEWLVQFEKHLTHRGPSNV